MSRQSMSLGTTSDQHASGGNLSQLKELYPLAPEALLIDFAQFPSLAAWATHVKNAVPLQAFNDAHPESPINPSPEVGVWAVATCLSTLLGRDTDTARTRDSQPVTTHQAEFNNHSFLTGQPRPALRLIAFYMGLNVTNLAQTPNWAHFRSQELALAERERTPVRPDVRPNIHVTHLVLKALLSDMQKPVHRYAEAIEHSGLTTQQIDAFLECNNSILSTSGKYTSNFMSFHRLVSTVAQSECLPKLSLSALAMEIAPGSKSERRKTRTSTYDPQ
jgi:hypothetical protein